MTASDSLELPDGEWQEYAACRETSPDAFYPLKGESTRPAKQVCAGCEVRVECLEYALARPSSVGRFGVWGGMSERERRRLRGRIARGEAAA